MRTPDRVTEAPVSSDLAERLQDFRAALEQQRLFRLDQLDELATMAAGVSPADAAQRQVHEILRTSATAALTEAEDALDRLRAGTFGRCEECAEPISCERLEILPMSRYCTPCQHRIELRSAQQPGR
jgi:RNA polymerase-binding transcription factor DksA